MRAGHDGTSGQIISVRIANMKVSVIGWCVGLWLLAAVSHASDLEVLRVWPEKLLYGLEETASIAVELHNSGAAEQDAELIITLITDLATERELLRQSVTLPPGATEQVHVSAELQEEFGHEVRAVLIQGGQEMSRGREVFTATDHAPRVSQYAFGGPMAGMEKDIRDQVIPTFRKNYISMVEIYFWSPSSFGDFAPDEETWSGGESRHFNGSKSAVRTYINGAHEHGIKVLTYVNHAFWGARSWEILREHPEWAMYLGTGQWYARFDYEETGGQPVGPENYLKSSACMINFVNEEVVDFGAQALVDGMEMFDYDGARWDGQWIVSGDYGRSDHFDVNGALNPRYPESDEMGARNYRRVKQRLREARPGFICGYNYGVRVTEGAAATLPKFYAETIGDRGWLLWETALPMSRGESEGLQTWPLVAHAIRGEARHVRDVGGELYMHVASGSSVFNSYLCSLAFSNRAHLSSPTDLGHWYKFAIRYGGLLYDPRLKLEDDTGIQVHADVPLWWKETVYTRSVSEKRSQLIVHLINPPANEKLDPKEKSAPPVQKNVRVEVDVPANSSLTGAYSLSPDPDTHSESLTPVMAGERASVAVPVLEFWNVVVFEFEKN